MYKEYKFLGLHNIHKVSKFSEYIRYFYKCMGMEQKYFDEIFRLIYSEDPY